MTATANSATVTDIPPATASASGGADSGAGKKPVDKRMLGGGAALILVGLYLLMGGGAPGARDLEDGVRAVMVQNAEDGIRMASAIGGARMGDMARAEVDKLRDMPITAEILSSQKLDNGDWKVRASVALGDGKSSGDKQTEDFIMSKRDGKWKVSENTW